MRKQSELPRGVHNGCPSGKLAHATRRGAKAQALSLHQVSGEHLRPYMCRDCFAWHIGHLAGQVLRGKKSAAQLYAERQRRAAS